MVALREAEHANLREALAWLAERGEAGAFLRLAALLGHFWAVQGHYQEGRAWLERALAQGDGTAADRPKALVALGMIAV
jgi:non-specific serine/threonine protein kinase